VKDVITVLKKVGELKIGDIVINTAAMPASERRKTNTLKITRVR
jgi:pyruvate kinase